MASKAITSWGCRSRTLMIRLRRSSRTQGLDVELVRATVPRAPGSGDLPLGIAQGQQVQQIHMRKFIDDDDNRTLGIYVDLALHAGPVDHYVPPRGNAVLAQSFRAPDDEIAFATSPGFFALLGPDAKFRRAELAARHHGIPLPVSRRQEGQQQQRAGNDRQLLCWSEERTRDWKHAEDRDGWGVHGRHPQLRLQRAVRLHAHFGLQGHRRLGVFSRRRPWTTRKVLFVVGG